MQMSKPNDAPESASTLASKSQAETTSSIQPAPRGPENQEPSQISPRSTSSLTSFERPPTFLGTSNGDTVHSPSHIDDAFGEDEASPRQKSREHMRDDGLVGDDARFSNKALTFPGPLSGPPHRTASLPHAGYGRENSSPSVKRHKCPYCNTDFTRHHNLKSHLLTHSQEKPFSCDRCDSRFRRLHDLKRHAKLHTGERPHVCPKCDRSFARGDALARHNKGQGGCAGRRESVGSFAGDDRHDDSLRTSDGDGMPGIIYTNEASHEPDHMDEETETSAERGLPRIQKHDAPAETQAQLPESQSLFHARQPSTYPPVAARPSGTGSLYPPLPMTSPRSGSGTSTAQSSINHYPPPALGPTSYQPPPSSVFTQSGGMTESPKPLSPGGVNAHQLGHSDSSLNRNRSPSLSQHLPPSHYRRATGSNTSPPVSLPLPHSASSLSNAPQLPPLHGLTTPEARYTLHSQTNPPTQLHSAPTGNLPASAHGSSTPNFQAGNVPSTNNSSSSHGTGQAGSLERNNPYGQPNERIWAYVETLAAKLNRLEEEVAVLRGQNGGPQNPR